MSLSVFDGEPVGNQDSRWPSKWNVIGVEVSDVTYEQACACIIDAAKQRLPSAVSCHAVHAIVTIGGNQRLRKDVNQFSMVTPDGQPVRWALNLLHRRRLKHRVYGPELTLRVCQEAASHRIPIYLYGGTDEVLEKLTNNLVERIPELIIAGSESPPFRELTDQEHQNVQDRINQSGAGIVLIGLGCPKQDQFAARHLGKINAVQLCVGAAFDFHAGIKPMAPKWMQNHGLEWVYRLSCEPRRLWRRYLVCNSIFVGKVFCDFIVRFVTGRRGREKPVPN